VILTEIRGGGTGGPHAPSPSLILLKFEQHGSIVTANRLMKKIFHSFFDVHLPITLIKVPPPLTKTSSFSKLKIALINQGLKFGCYDFFAFKSSLSAM